MESWQAIQETIEYIEVHYGKVQDIETLAKVAHLSKYYYQRLFYRLVHKTVKEYITLRRLAKASEALKNSQQRIIDIALACGFDSHSTFSRTFKQVYGITPIRYRKGSYKLDHFNKPDLSLRYIDAKKEVPLIVEDMVLEIREEEVMQDSICVGQSKLALVNGIGEAKINQLVELWDMLAMDGKQEGLDILTNSEDPAYFNYFVGIENECEMEGYETRIIPKGKYVVCSYESEDFDTLVNVALYKASRYLYESWLPNHHKRPESILIQKYFRCLQTNCYIELWAKVIEN